MAVAIPALFLLLSGFNCHKAVPPSGLPVVNLSINGKTISAEVANTEVTRETGLMFRREMGKDDGMLFVFPDTAPRAFWMKNTLIPLNIAFIDEKGIILNLWEMPPMTENPFESAGPAKYALEMNTGWFTSNGAKPGDQVQGVLDAPRDPADPSVRTNPIAVTPSAK